MLLLQTEAAIIRAADTYPDPTLRRLLSLRIAGLQPYGCDLAELVTFLVVEPGDTLADIETALGFSPLVNFVDGSRYPDPEYVPSWEWVAAHPGWFEAFYVLTDDGYGWVLWIADQPGVPGALLAVAQANAIPPAGYG